MAACICRGQSPGTATPAPSSTPSANQAAPSLDERVKALENYLANPDEAAAKAAADSKEIEELGLNDRVKKEILARFPNATIRSLALRYAMGNKQTVEGYAVYRTAEKERDQIHSFRFVLKTDGTWEFLWDIPQ